MSFYIVALEGCPYSQNCVETFRSLKNVPHEVHWVNNTTKMKYKTSTFSTFPQISYIITNKKGKKEIFIGGQDKLEKLLSIKNIFQNNQIPKSAIFCLFSLIQD